MTHSWQGLFVLQGRAKHNPSTFLVEPWPITEPISCGWSSHSN